MYLPSNPLLRVFSDITAINRPRLWIYKRLSFRIGLPSRHGSSLFSRGGNSGTSFGGMIIFLRIISAWAVIGSPSNDGNSDFLLAYKRIHFCSSGTTTFSGEATLPKPILFPSKKGSTVNGKNLLHGSKFFPFRVDPFFRRGLVCRKRNIKSNKLIPFQKWWQNFLVYAFSLIITWVY